MALGGRSEWPLVGRAAELDRVGALLRAGRGGVVLAGPAGVGKTRLAGECLALAGQQGFVPLRVPGTQAAASMPLGAFATFLPELRATPDRTEMRRRVARAVVSRGGGKPVVLLVDDAHLLDDSSVALTRHLAGDEQTFLLATVRSGEPAAEAVLALCKDGLVECLDLPPLTLDHVAALLAEVLDGPVDPATVRLLWERTEGNPLFLKEFVLSAQDAGVLREDGGVWRVQGTLPASDRLVELVEARLGALSQTDRQALELLAVWEPVGAETFDQLTGGAGVKPLERQQLVRIDPDGRRLTLRLAHPLYGEVLRARLSRLRSRRASRAMADALEATGLRRRDDVLRVATWRLDGGGDIRPEVMLAAAQDRQQRRSN